MKLRKMKERRNHYRTEKDNLKLQVEGMQKDNEALFQQINSIQESSHATREDNANTKTELKQTQKELEIVQ